MKNIRKQFSLLLVLTLVFILSATVFAYNDMNGHWGAEAVAWATEAGLVKGYENGSFLPDEKVTNAEFYTMVNNLANLTKKASINFADVNASDWFYQEVQKAVGAGYLANSSGNLNPDGQISRDEASRILAYVYKLSDNAQATAKFVDAAAIQNKGAVGALVVNKILNGNGDGTFLPADSLSRAEAAQIFKNAVGALGMPDLYKALKTSTPIKTKGAIEVNYGYRNWSKSDFYKWHRDRGYHEYTIDRLWNDYLDNDYWNYDYWYNNDYYYGKWTKSDFYKWHRDRGYSEYTIDRLWEDYRDGKYWTYRYWYDDDDYYKHYYNKWYDGWTKSDFYKWHRDNGYPEYRIDRLWEDYLDGNYWNYYYWNDGCYKYWYGKGYCGDWTKSDFYKYFRDLGKTETQIDRLWDMYHGGSYRYYCDGVWVDGYCKDGYWYDGKWYKHPTEEWFKEKYNLNCRVECDHTNDCITVCQ